MLNLGKRAKGHFVTLIEIGVHLIKGILFNIHLMCGPKGNS